MGEREDSDVKVAKRCGNRGAVRCLVEIANKKTSLAIHEMTFEKCLNLKTYLLMVLMIFFLAD